MPADHPAPAHIHPFIQTNTHSQKDNEIGKFFTCVRQQQQQPQHQLWQKQNKRKKSEVRLYGISRNRYYNNKFVCVWSPWMGDRNVCARAFRVVICVWWLSSARCLFHSLCVRVCVSWNFDSVSLFLSFVLFWNCSSLLSSDCSEVLQFFFFKSTKTISDDYAS